MKVLIANKFHSRRGGDCVYSLNLQDMLEQNGHEVAFFAMQHPENLPSKWECYFPSEVSFSPKKPLQFIKAIFRPFFSFEVWWKFRKLLNDFQPGVVHLNNIHSQLSPLIAKMAHDRGIRVVWTLHDYKLLCPRYDCLRNDKPCEICFSGAKSNVMWNKCLKGSLIASVIAWLEAVIWSRKRIEKSVDMFICPSEFMKKKVEQGGYSPSKLFCLHNFIGSKRLTVQTDCLKNHYCYVGRLSNEKGIRTLLRAAVQRPQYLLKVFGGGPLEANLRNEFGSFSHIQFYGHSSWEVCKTGIASAKFCVVPSEWYENNPFSVIESIALGTAVLGSNMGGIPELIFPGHNGLLFNSGSVESLLEGIDNLWNQTAYNVDRRYNDEQVYYRQIRQLYTCKN